MNLSRPDSNYQKWSDSFDAMDASSTASADENEKSARAHEFMAQLARHLAPQSGTVPGFETAVLLRIKAERRRKEWQLALLVSASTGLVFLSAFLLAENSSPLLWISHSLTASRNQISSCIVSLVNHLSHATFLGREFFILIEGIGRGLIVNLWPLLFIAPLFATAAAYLSCRANSHRPRKT